MYPYTTVCKPEPDLLEDPDEELVDVVLQPRRRLDELGAGRHRQILALCEKRGNRKLKESAEDRKATRGYFCEMD